MRPPLQVRWRAARSIVKFQGRHGLRAWWFIVRETLRGDS